MIKPNYSPEVLAILNDEYIKENLKIAHELRVRQGKPDCSDAYLVKLALDMYIRHWERRLTNRLKKEIKSGDTNARTV
jgi:hypothetical protein